MSGHAMPHSVQTSTLSDVLERVLDKGIVIAGDIKVKLVDIELLSIQIRLVICSVDKAREMGMDWWVNNPVFSSQPRHERPELEEQLSVMSARLAKLEAANEGGTEGEPIQTALPKELSAPARKPGPIARPR